MFAASRRRALCLLILLTSGAIALNAADPPEASAGETLAGETLAGETPTGSDPFLQIDGLLPTPDESRLASGAPGPDYWQQSVSYQIDVTIDEASRTLRGKERIRYENHSPHTLRYLWLQLEINQFSPASDAVTTRTWKHSEEIPLTDLERLAASQTFNGGMRIVSVKDGDGRPLPHVINKAHMRVDLPEPLAAGAETSFEVVWEYAINNVRTHPARTGYELLDDGQALFGLAFWYPRLCAYTDYGGWRLKQFIGYGEFTLEFGDFDVRISVPTDHVVAATGKLMNEEEVLSPEMRDRLAAADKADRPVFIVTPEEADAKRKGPPSNTYQTWHFQADNVRDFAFACSRAHLWDAWGIPIGGRTVRCMSFYPREGMPLWDRYATHAIAQTLEVYSDVTGIPYPWPHATSVLGVHSSGMEYPMINFNHPRPEKDGTYSESLKRRVIGVIIHETGHNWFPMIVNNDERHWMWMDEGFNRFVQGYAERRWNKKMEEIGQPRLVTAYLTGITHQPIMTQPDNLQDVGKNAYTKTSVGLTMLRETILGRELFDFAFREYCRRWAYKRPQPADFFRTFEDASGMDLDWFWRGWFFSAAHCDMELAAVTRRTLETGHPARDKQRFEKSESQKPENLTVTRDGDLALRVDKHQDLKDFYDSFDPHAVTPKKQESFQKFLDRLTPEEKQMLSFDKPLYEIRIRNNGGLPMPVTLKLAYEDGSTELKRYPAEIWRLTPNEITLLIVAPQPLQAVQVDPFNETADPDFGNNRYPRRIEETELKLISPEKKIENPLHDERERQQEAEKKEAEKETEKKEVEKTPSQGNSVPPAPAGS